MYVVNNVRVHKLELVKINLRTPLPPSPPPYVCIHRRVSVTYLNAAPIISRLDSWDEEDKEQTPRFHIPFRKSHLVKKTNPSHRNFSGHFLVHDNKPHQPKQTPYILIPYRSSHCPNHIDTMVAFSFPFSWTNLWAGEGEGGSTFQAKTSRRRPWSWAHSAPPISSIVAALMSVDVAMAKGRFPNGSLFTPGRGESFLAEG